MKENENQSKRPEIGTWYKTTAGTVSITIPGTNPTLTLTKADLLRLLAALDA